MKRLLAAALLLLASCASQPQTVATAPQWTEVPSLIAEGVCGRLQQEGISGESPIAIVRTTQNSLVTVSSMTSLGHFFGKGGNAAALAQAIRETSPQIPVSVTDAPSCQWQPIDRVDPSRDSQTVIVQLSPPFVNPYEVGEAGMFARMSIGGQDAQWYWIPLAERGGRWLIGLILPIQGE